ncbi:Zinc finger C2HC domain-containing protein 1A [Trichoplax sp. H2]|nr:Zinc finger C2HC domain-containing protein 1A [Trichoplax sp. H2]|eukprot:RDD44770.1 Zinc finger C2HC domain-containing protein 1A [Trichoplax sp. H2]
MDEEIEDYDPSEFAPCSHCGRTFNPDVLARHEKICQKSANKKRKVFNSFNQRILGTDINKTQALKALKETDKKDKPKGGNWKQKHEDFLSTIRSARKVTQAVKEGKPLPPPPPSKIDPSLVQCPYCQRRFNPDSAERHIKFCKEQSQRVPRNSAKQQLNKRTQYKPPMPKGSSSKQMSTPISATSRNALTSRANIDQVDRKPSSGSAKNHDQFASSSIPSKKTMTIGGKSTGSYGLKAPSTGIKKPSYGYHRTTSGDENSRSGNSASKISQNRTIPKGTFNGSRQNKDTYDTSTSSALSQAKPKFCHECGTKYPVQNAKFCCECGVKRLHINT